MPKKDFVAIVEELLEARTSKQWGKFESLAREALDQEPNKVYYIQAVGEGLEKQGHVIQALEYYEKALAVDRQEQNEIGHTFFLKRLDILYHRLGRYEDCLRVCEYYNSRHDDSWDAWNRLRRAAHKTGNIELCTIASDRAIEIKTQIEAEKRISKTRSLRLRSIYEMKLKEMGIEESPPESPPSALHDEPPPSFEASDEEWGMWARRTTDLEEAEARLQAMLFAAAELEEMERDEE